MISAYGRYSRVMGWGGQFPQGRALWENDLNGGRKYKQKEQVQGDYILEICCTTCLYLTILYST